MPKISGSCPKCNGKATTHTVYVRLPKEGKKSKWIRLKKVFFCVDCQKLVIYCHVKNGEIIEPECERIGSTIVVP